MRRGAVAYIERLAHVQATNNAEKLGHGRLDKGGIRPILARRLGMVLTCGPSMLTRARVGGSNWARLGQPKKERARAGQCEEEGKQAGWAKTGRGRKAK